MANAIRHDQSMAQTKRHHSWFTLSEAGLILVAPLT